MDLLSVEQAAAELGVSPRRVRQLATVGRLRAEKVGWVWMIPRAALAKRKIGKPGAPRKKR